MNYVLFQENYLKQQLIPIVNKIYSTDLQSKVYIISKEKWKYKNVKTLDPKVLQEEKFENSMLGYFYPKIFIFKKLIKQNIIDSLVHFEADTILLKSFKETKKTIIKEKINITDLQLNQFSYGYLYLDNLSLLEEICDKYMSIVTSKKDIIKNNNLELINLKKIYNSYPNMFNLLPVLPNSHNLSYDPGGYGRYLLGSGLYLNKIMPGKYRFIDEQVGTEISSKRLSIKLINNKVKTEWNNKKFELVSLRSYMNSNLLKI